MSEQNNNQGVQLSELLQIRRDKLTELVAEGRDPFVITKFELILSIKVLISLILFSVFSIVVWIFWRSICRYNSLFKRFNSAKSYNRSSVFNKICPVDMIK